MSDEPAISTRVLTVPNLISAARLLMVPVFVVIFLAERYLLAFSLLAILSTTDWVDGFVARRTGQVSKLGKLLDPLADRIAIVVVVALFAFTGTIPWVLAVIILGRDLIVVIAFAAFESRGLPRLAVNRTGKAATAFIYFGIAIAAASLMAGETGARELLGDPGGAVADGVHRVAISLAVIGAILYWVAAGLYASEARRALGARGS
ncbi:MAG: CDP-alcohol phosphatidyltransferase family protein [Actinomycetota bacterium]